MRKLVFCNLLLFLVLLYGCSNRDAPASATRTYVLEHSEFSSPAVTLLDDNSFSFVLHRWSSFWPVGTYSIENGRLFLTVGDQVAYVFSIEGDAIIFIEEESWDIPSFRMSYDAATATPAFVDGDRFVLLTGNL